MCVCCVCKPQIKIKYKLKEETLGEILIENKTFFDNDNEINYLLVFAYVCL